jgi:hypothetical protein
MTNLVQTFRVPAASCISPCGSWVVAGSSCGSVIVWNTDTGAKQGQLTIRRC